MDLFERVMLWWLMKHKPEKREIRTIVSFWKRKVMDEPRLLKISNLIKLRRLISCKSLLIQRLSPERALI